MSTAATVPARRWTYVIPVAAVMYMLAYLDRNNVSIIMPYMDDDFPLSASAKGMASGIFFVGYMFLQIPAAVLAARWSARKTVLILMAAWGLAAMACGLVRSEGQLYAARFVLGLFEGGVWPAVLILLASWFPLRERARANALWMACLPISSIIMAPLSGWMLDHMDWRTVFVAQGVPPLVWAAVWWFAIADRPSQARWVSPEERAHVERALAEDEAAKPSTGQATYGQTLRDRRVQLLVLVYFCWITGFYGFNLWLPSVIKSITGDASATAVGSLTAVPYVVALAAMVYNAARSDRTGNRRAAVAIPQVVAIVGLLAGQLVHNGVAQMALLCVVAAGVYAPYGPFWAMPAQVLRFEVIAVAMGLINALGNLGGFMGPYLVGWLTDLTGSQAAGFVALAGFLAAGAAVSWFCLRPTPAVGDHAVAAQRTA
ncbi:MAG: MFS transporter [Actinomadura rubrobrunea]|nr:MFS transporter [Actinomadura rubrobrunea]